MTAEASPLELWRRADPILAQALELPEAQRRRFVERTCGDDSELFRIVESLLDWAEREDPWLTGGRALAGSIGEALAVDPAAPAQPEPEPDRSGTRLGRFEIVGSLGRGGMGEVWEAFDPALRRHVALKILPLAYAADGERRARFELEARLLAQLRHPHIALIHDLQVVGATHALVMELVPGPTLAERMTSGPLSLEESCALARQLAEALEEAHAKGIVHRDLKPSNIKAPPGGDLKVLDFGIAKVVGQAAAGLEGTQADMILGTAAYMAPEQARGDAIDKQVDIWAFGVILYEMLTGGRLFAGDGREDAMAAVLHREIDLDRLPAGTPAPLRELLRRCLERDPRRRLQDIGEGRIAIESIIAEGGDARGGRRRASRRRLGFGLAAAAGVLAAAALSGLLKVNVPRPAEATDVREITFSGTDGEPTASPDGRSIAYASRRDGRPRIWVQQLDDGAVAPVTEGPDGRPRFSPDGASLLFVRGLGVAQALYRVAAEGGEPQRLVDGAAEGDWSPDGGHVVFVRSNANRARRTQLAILDLASGKERTLLELGDTGVGSPRWSPDGRSVAFVSGGWPGNNWRLRQVDVATGRVTPLGPGKPGPMIGGLAWSGGGERLFYIQAPSDTGEVSGAASRIARLDLRTGRSETVLRHRGLALMNATANDISPVDILAPGRLLFGRRVWRQDLREVAAGTTSAAGTRVLTRSDAIDRQPVYSPDGARILYSSGRGGNVDLWTVDRVSGAARQITNDAADDWDPAYTRDGRHILFSSNRAGGRYEVWMANADGSGARQVTHDGVSAQNPTATPDGRWIVYWSTHPDKLGLWKIRPDGSGASRLYPGQVNLPEVSPDGRHVVFLGADPNDERLGGIHVVEIASGRPVSFRIPLRHSLAAARIIWGRARWSPDGSGLYYVGMDERGLSGIYYQDFAPDRDTSASRRPVAGFSPDYVTESFAVSPDGSHLTLALGQDYASILVADHVPGALPPRRNLSVHRATFIAP